MSGSKIGGKKAAATNTRNDKDFYRRIGAIGGKLGHDGGFGSNKVGADGLTGKQRAAISGAKGGRISKRVKQEQS